MKDADRKWMKLMYIGERLGCHQMPERSFFYHGYQFPVCARCTGVLFATILAVPVFIKRKISPVLCILLSAVMFIDWFLQYLHIRESTNVRRLLTGAVGGFGYTMLHLYLYRFVWKGIRNRIKSERRECV